ncbi:MAG: MFS transporter [Methanobacteriota archaeon]|nr:MAG: MFS transporter [Euryarchaeota archaeon]TMA03908.1 MAG: MFS transporter [Euryarchaeota archaeon]
MAAVFSPTSPPRTPRRRTYRSLIGILAVQAFANQMAASFWLVYLVSPPQSLDFDVAILVWVIGFGVAACTVLSIARGRPIQATTSMVSGLAIMVLGHLSFAFLPALWGMFLGSVCFGLYVPLFWLPLNSLVVRETNHANRAGRLAGITATFAITGVLAPIVGGWIADRASYRLVFELAGVAVTANLLLVRWLAQSDETLVFSLDLKRVGRRTALAFTGQGGVDGLISAATPLGSFLFTSASFELGLLFALFSLAAGIAAVILGRVSDRVRVRTPFLLLGPLLSVPACLLAYLVRDLGAFAFAIGWLSMTSAVAPSFIYTILIDRTEKEIPTVTATRELILNTSRTLALLGGLAVLALGGDVYALYLLVGGVILLEALAK